MLEYNLWDLGATYSCRRRRRGRRRFRGSRGMNEVYRPSEALLNGVIADAKHHYFENNITDLQHKKCIERLAIEYKKLFAEWQKEAGDACISKICLQGIANGDIPNAVDAAQTCLKILNSGE